MPTSPENQNCEITFTALRAAFVSTLDSLLRYSLDPGSICDHPTGFFHCFPMLNGMAPQVQMECLLRTWERWSQNHSSFPDLLDQCVLYGAYESLGRVSTAKNDQSLRVVLNGPRSRPELDDHWLTAKTRCLQVAGAGPVTVDLLRELVEPTDPSPWLAGDTVSETDSARDELMELVGRWRIRREQLLAGAGLLTSEEIEILREFFEEHPGLVG
ncbi:MAG: hypothetical protein JNM43_12015 [Planctomycetaceae bacterium]|nr:hypothetical protein [Planctomycetaceae bacterium]